MTKPILVAVDFTDATNEAVKQADALAVALNRPLQLVHVYTIPEIAIVDFRYVQSAEKVAAACDVAEQEMERIAKDLRSSKTNVKVVTGDVVSELLKLCEEASIVVVGTHGRGLVDKLILGLGSVSERISKHARCSVFIARPEGNEA